MIQRQFSIRSVILVAVLAAASMIAAIFGLGLAYRNVLTAQQNGGQFDGIRADAWIPDGAVIQRNEIGVISGILALCKAFDALTSRRAARPAHAPEAALKILTEAMSPKFRPDLLPLFARFVQGQPVRPANE